MRSSGCWPRLPDETYAHDYAAVSLATCPIPVADDDDEVTACHAPSSTRIRERGVYRGSAREDNLQQAIAARRLHLSGAVVGDLVIDLRTSKAVCGVSRLDGIVSPAYSYCRRRKDM